MSNPERPLWVGLAALVLVPLSARAIVSDDRPAVVDPAPIAGDAGDPLAYARARRGQVDNLEAGIPPPCYTATGPASNPCWTCHTDSQAPNGMADWRLQQAYAFSEVGLHNRWHNLFVDRRPAIAAQRDEDTLAYLRVDNYAPLRAALATRADYDGYRPDLDLARGFDAHGLARDGSGWRAYRYKPFPGAFWPTNGSVGDGFIRLPVMYRSGSDGAPSSLIYRANLAILEASLASDPRAPDRAVVRVIDPIDERALGVDLDADGHLSRETATLRGLPTHYLGAAADVPVRRGLYPEGAELLHSVRYIDPDAPTLLAARMKELRYMKKVQALDRWAMQAAYASEQDARDEGKLPPPTATQPSTTSAKRVTRSRSQKGNTVSRCMLARSMGSLQAITRSAPPLAKSARAIWPMACGVVRSPIPTSTVRLPIGMTSPPSAMACPKLLSGSPHQTGKPASRKSGWNR